MTSILVTGGTGTLGRAVVARLANTRHDVRVLTRRADVSGGQVSGDLVTGRGLARALDGVGTVLHLATTLRGRRDVVATQNLVAVAGHVRHLVFASIVGVDRIPIGYYRGKLAAERAVSALPHTILRATQFHDLLRTILAGLARLPVMPLPLLRVQPVDVRDVADRLVELAGGEPVGRAPAFGGPETGTLREWAEAYLRAAGKRRLKVGLWLPGAAFRSYRDGANLVVGGDHGTRTFTSYLAEVAA
jgi:uncharacterized protein YbjT (DUF2867 family)